jgi:hypothetical protein
MRQRCQYVARKPDGCGGIISMAGGSIAQGVAKNKNSTPVNATAIREIERRANEKGKRQRAVDRR